MPALQPLIYRAGILRSLDPRDCLLQRGRACTFWHSTISGCLRLPATGYRLRVVAQARDNDLPPLH